MMRHKVENEKLQRQLKDEKEKVKAGQEDMKKLQEMYQKEALNLKEEFKKEFEKETMRRSFQLEMDFQTKMSNAESQYKSVVNTTQEEKEMLAKTQN